jgi:hypothetical protein
VEEVEAYQAPAFIGTYEGVGCHKCARSYPQADSELIYCPGCGKSHWIIGNHTAQCAFCDTALDLQRIG